MKQRGFTLIELMGIIIILSLLSLLIIPGIDLAIKEFKTHAYEGQLKNIKLAANDWALDNVPKYALKDGDAITITLAQLKMSNLVDHNIINSKTDEPFADDMIINIVRDNNNFTFDVDAASGAQIGLADNAPIITLKGNYVEKRYENHGYVDLGATAKTSAGVAIPATSITKVIRKNGVVVPSINDADGTYTIAYSVTDNGITRTVYRIVMFEELKPSTPAVCFTFDEATKTLTGYDPLITGCGYDVIIPRTINGTSVEIIAYAAFENKQIKSVIIPSSVTVIGSYAFRGNQLTSVTIPSSVTAIGNFAFRGNQLTSVTIPSSVTDIGSYAFANNQLTSVTIPNSVTTIGDYSFFINQLTSVTIPNSVTTIGGSAFAGNQLTSVTIPNSVTTIGSYAFNKNQLTSVDIGNGITTIYMGAFRYNYIPQGSAIIRRASGSVTLGTDVFALNGVGRNTTITPTYIP